MGLQPELLGVGVPTAASDHPRFAPAYITTSGPRFLSVFERCDCGSRMPCPGDSINPVLTLAHENRTLIGRQDAALYYYVGTPFFVSVRTVWFPVCLELSKIMKWHEQVFRSQNTLHRALDIVQRISHGSTIY